MNFINALIWSGTYKLTHLWIRFENRNLLNNLFFSKFSTGNRKIVSRKKWVSGAKRVAQILPRSNQQPTLKNMKKERNRNATFVHFVLPTLGLFVQLGLCCVCGLASIIFFWFLFTLFLVQSLYAISPKFELNPVKTKKNGDCVNQKDKILGANLVISSWVIVVV